MNSTKKLIIAFVLNALLVFLYTLFSFWMNKGAIEGTGLLVMYTFFLSLHLLVSLIITIVFLIRRNNNWYYGLTGIVTAIGGFLFCLYGIS